MKLDVRVGVFAAMSLAACGSKSSTETGHGSAAEIASSSSVGSANASGSGGQGSAPSSATVPADPGSDVRSATAPASRDAKQPPPTKEARAAYRTHMKAGWKLQADKNWSAAVSELRAALDAIPDDQRALAELGWSAQNAGDLQTAKIADEKAIAVAADKKVKAAGYYNLGTVLEKTGDKDGALKAYLASLQLRPNKTVEEAVRKLGADPATAASGIGACAKPDPCACASELAPDVWENEPPCTEATDVALPVKGLKAWTYGNPGEGETHYTYLFDGAGHYIGALASEARFGRHDASSKTEKLEVRKVGNHQVLWLETSYGDEVTYGTETGMDETRTTGRLVTLCVVDDGKPVSCPLREVPTLTETSRLFIPDDGDESWDRAKTSKTVLDIAIGDDGVATVKLVSGPSADLADGVLGPHKLW